MIPSLQRDVKRCTGTIIWLSTPDLYQERALTILFSYLRGDFRRGPAALQVQAELPFLLYRTIPKRRHVQKIRRVSDHQVMSKMYWGSVVIKYFILKRRDTVQILHRHKL